MSFLAPLFFLALAGLAIPVLLHLTQREKKQIVHFPSLMFVRRIPYQSVRRRKIHNWLLLMVRLAALALIVLAFARPLIQRDSAAPIGAGSREVVVLLDNSYSMGFGDHWTRAMAAARAEFDKLNASDRGSLVLFSSGADIQLRSTSERDRLNAAVATAKPGDAATRFSPALKVAGSVVAESTLPRREVVHHQRLPAWRLARRGRGQAAAGRDAHAGGDPGRGRPGESHHHGTVARAVDVLQSGTAHRDRGHRQPQ